MKNKKSKPARSKETPLEMKIPTSIDLTESKGRRIERIMGSFFFNLIIPSAKYLALMFLSNWLFLGSAAWKVSALVVKDNLVQSFTWITVMGILLALLVYGVFCFRHLNYFGLSAAVLLLLIPFSDVPGIYIKLSWILFGIGFLDKFSTLTFGFSIENLFRRKKK